MQKSLARFSALLAFALCWLLASTAAGALESRVALVIGNSRYMTAPQLSNPFNDATDMAAVLRRAGFQVIERTDLSKKEMERAIALFGDNLRKDSVALFYYAGHALQVRNKNYLLPIDAEIKAENHVRAEGVDVDQLLEQLMVSELNIVILDACRDNPYARKFRSTGGGGLAQMEAPAGSLIAYSTAPGKTAADGNGRNGLYTQELLKQIHLNGNRMEIGTLLRQVRKGVSEATNGTQLPWESSSLMGEFYFFPPAQAALPARAMANQPTAAAAPDVRRERPAPETVTAKKAEAPAERRVETPATAPAAMAAGTQTDRIPDKLAVAAPTEKAGTAAGESRVAEKAPAAVDASGRQTLTVGNSVIRGTFRKHPQTGEITGDVEIEWPDNSRYVGAMVEGKYHGQGTFAWGNGQRYTGNWINGVASGRGALQFPNGDRYEGEVQDGIMHGTGTYSLINGDSYTGEWVQGKKHGKGRLTWASGSYWEGEFINDQYSDKGRLVDEKSAALSAAARPPAASPAPEGKDPAPVAAAKGKGKK